ncbi:MAG: TlpA disulfide reductase family protein [Mariprofundaceae bacterium]|nr:TlpA disulfide reductase family protein [Mariprofundaceae bacterium]
MRFFVILVCFFSFLFTPHAAFADSGEGKLRWVDANEQEYELQQYRGKPVLLHFWAAWCGPCRNELPSLLDWDRQHPEIQVIYLSLDRRIGQAAYFLKESHLDIIPLLVDQDDARAFGIRGLPSSLLVNAEGVIQQRISGERTWSNGSMDYLLH